MRPVRLYPLLGAVVLMLLALTFAACAPQTSQWSPAEAPKENVVRFIRLDHDVRFAPAGDRLGAGEADRLVAFLRREDVGYGDRVTLLAADTPAGRRQREAVAALLARNGIRTGEQPPAAGVGVAPDAVRVVVGRHVVTPPACPNWSKPPGDDFGNQPYSNFGCATAMNLGLMVADPGDLVHGRAAGPADGEAVAHAIRRYREGKVTPLASDAGAPPTVNLVGGGQ